MMITKGWTLARTIPGSLTSYSFIGILGTPEVAAVLYSVTLDTRSGMALLLIQQNILISLHFLILHITSLFTMPKAIKNAAANKFPLFAAALYCSKV